MGNNIFARWLALLAMGVSLAPQAWSQQPESRPAQPRSLAQDIGLRANGMLVGRVTDATGQGKAGVAVRLLQQGKTIAQTTSIDDGSFDFNGVKAGVYQIRTAEAGGIYRLWAPQTAPPQARDSAVLQAQFQQTTDTVRGQAIAPPVDDDDTLAVLLLLGGVGTGLYFLLKDDGGQGAAVSP